MTWRQPHAECVGCNQLLGGRFIEIHCIPIVATTATRQLSLQDFSPFLALEYPCSSQR